jgi:bifunctional non-homologous end joining protein LigD
VLHRRPIFAVRKFFVQAVGFPPHQFELLNVGWSTLQPMRDKALPASKSLAKKETSFVPPMECLAVPKIPEGPLWVYEVKLDGYRAIGVNPKQGKPALFSRRGKSFYRKFPDVSQALKTLPRGTVIDGEVVALDDTGRPDFHLLTHSRSSAQLRFYVFDLLFFEDKDVMALPLLERRKLLKSLTFESEMMKLLEYFETSAAEMLDVVRQHGLEGVVGKRLGSPYEPGRRSGAWVKHRIAQQQDFVIGGFIPETHGIDSLIVGEYSGKELMYVSRVRAGLGAGITQAAISETSTPHSQDLSVRQSA